MHYFAGSVFTTGELLILGLYLFANVASVAVIIFCIAKIAIDKVRRRPFQRKLVSSAGIALVALLVAQVLWGLT